MLHTHKWQPWLSSSPVVKPNITGCRRDVWNFELWLSEYWTFSFGEDHQILKELLIRSCPIFQPHISLQCNKVRGTAVFGVPFLPEENGSNVSSLIMGFVMGRRQTTASDYSSCHFEECTFPSNYLVLHPYHALLCLHIPCVWVKKQNCPGRLARP